jgi:hypothetical protein
MTSKTSPALPTPDPLDWISIRQFGLSVPTLSIIPIVPAAGKMTLLSNPFKGSTRRQPLCDWTFDIVP